MLIQIIILVIYVNHFAKIVRQGIHFKHFRKGRLFREGSGGGLIVRIPFSDVLEVEGGDLRPADKKYIRAFIKTVPPGERYLLIRRGVPIKEYHERERIIRMPFFDWIEVVNDRLDMGV
jgi:hypothetical protein